MTAFNEILGVAILGIAHCGIGLIIGRNAKERLKIEHVAAILVLLIISSLMLMVVRNQYVEKLVREGKVVWVEQSTK